MYLGPPAPGHIHVQHSVPCTFAARSPSPSREVGFLRRTTPTEDGLAEAICKSTATHHLRPGLSHIPPCPCPLHSHWQLRGTCGSDVFAGPQATRRWTPGPTSAIGQTLARAPHNFFFFALFPPAVGCTREGRRRCNFTGKCRSPEEPRRAGKELSSQVPTRP